MSSAFVAQTNEEKDNTETKHALLSQQMVDVIHNVRACEPEGLSSGFQSLIAPKQNDIQMQTGKETRWGLGLKVFRVRDRSGRSDKVKYYPSPLL